MSLLRTRWAAIGAAVAVTLGGGGLVMVDAAQGSGERGVYNPITACRLIDTRPNKGIGGKTSPLGPGEILVVQTHGSSGECTDTPSDIIAVQLNITPVLPTQATDLTVWPGGTAPNASSLNPAPGQPPTPNAVTTEVDDNGRFRVRNKFGNVHVIIDLAGYYRDHHHDDRYYKKAEVDTKIAASPAGWEVIPSGVTVTGNLHWDSTVWADVGGDFAIGIDLPAIAPVALTGTTVNFAPSVAGVGDPAWIVDGDPTCTGSAATPTAPAGKVCLYAEDLRNVRSVNGTNQLAFSNHLDTHGFAVIFNYDQGTASAGGDFGINATWAYTAP